MHPGNALKFKGIGQVHEVYFSWRGVLLDFIEVVAFFLHQDWMSFGNWRDWLLDHYFSWNIDNSPSYHWINWIIDNSPSFWVVDNDFCIIFLVTNYKFEGIPQCRVLIFVSKPPRSHTFFTASAWRLRVHHLDCDPWAILSVFSVKNTCCRETRDKGLYEQWKNWVV